MNDPIIALTNPTGLCVCWGLHRLWTLRCQKSSTRNGGGYPEHCNGTGGSNLWRHERGCTTQNNTTRHTQRRGYQYDSGSIGVVPLHSTAPMGPHPPSIAGRPQGACGVAPVPRPTWRMPTVRPTHHAPSRPIGAAHAVHSGASLVHEGAPTSRTAKPHGLCPPQSSRVYKAPGENIAAGWPHLPRGIPSQSSAHMGPAVVVPHQVLGGEISRQVPLFQCQAQHAASAMHYMAQPWFLHQCAVLSASLLDSYRDALDNVVRQSRHWHSLLRPAQVWITSADWHYQRHKRRVELFSVMSQFWASERVARWLESPLPKRQCRTRPGILGQRPPPDMAPRKRRKLGPAHT